MMSGSGARRMRESAIDSEEKNCDESGHWDKSVGFIIGVEFDTLGGVEDSSVWMEVFEKI